MKFYFTLQFNRLCRWFEEIGINAWLGIVFSIFLFVLSSAYLFIKTNYAPWIYCILASYILIYLSNKNRNDQLRIIYNKKPYRKLRLIENGLIVTPFILFVIFKHAFLFIIPLFTIAIALVFFNSNLNWNKVLPTPFKKFPFEFIVGFRKTFLFFLFSFFLIYKAIQVDNYELGLSALGASFFTIMSFYTNPEKKYFVWIFSKNPSGFIKRKMIDASLCTFILTTPALIILLTCFQENILITIALNLIGYIFVYSIIVAKYSAFPKQMNIPQALLYVLAIGFAPLMLVIIPIFYIKSKGKLTPILE